MPINPLPPLAIAGCERSKRCLLLWRAVGKGTGRGAAPGESVIRIPQRSGSRWTTPETSTILPVSDEIVRAAPTHILVRD